MPKSLGSSYPSAAARRMAALGRMADPRCHDRCVGVWGTAAYAEEQHPGPIGASVGGASYSGRMQFAFVWDNHEEPLVSVVAAIPEVTEGEDVVFRLSRSGPVSDRLVVGLYVGGHHKIMSIETGAIASAGGGGVVDTTVAFEEGDGEVLVRVDHRRRQRQRGRRSGAGPDRTLRHIPIRVG